jgi:hypothetical protein
MNISRTEVFQASAVSCGLSARGGSYIKNYDIQSHKNKLGVEKILLEISWKGDTLKYRISYRNYLSNKGKLLKKGSEDFDKTKTALDIQGAVYRYASSAKEMADVYSRLG